MAAVIELNQRRTYPAIAGEKPHHVVGLFFFFKRDDTGRCRGKCWHGHQGSRQVLDVGIGVHVRGRMPEPMRGAPGSDGVTATGKGETAPSGALVSEP